MQGIFEDLTGQKFGRWTVIKYIGNSKWLCKCDCGNIKVVQGGSLKNGNTQSCGCLQKEKASFIMKKHGLYKSRLYKLWRSMKNRCQFKTNLSYKNYGGRGIKVCDEWLNDFMNFYNWAMANGYKDDLTIERIDVNGNYEPNNCKWINNIEQAWNRRSSYFITYNNETHCLAEWAKIYNIKYNTLWARIKRGSTFKEAILKEVQIPLFIPKI